MTEHAGRIPQDYITVQERRDVHTIDDVPEELVDGIRHCVQRAFGGGHITDEDARHHMLGDQLLVALDDDEVVAFTSTSITSPDAVFPGRGYSTESGVYFAAAAVDPRVQRAGLYEQMNESRLKFGLGMLENDGSESPNVFTRTQNPRVAAGIRRSIARSAFRVVSVEHTHYPNAYGHMLTSTRPSYATPSEFDLLDYERGDALLVRWIIAPAMRRVI